MKIKFDKKIIPPTEVKVQSLKKRRWDRWVYLGILLFLVISFARWLATPLFFNFAEGMLLQQHYDVQFANDVRILHYNVDEDSQVQVGDTLFLYENLGSAHSTYAQDSIQLAIDRTEINSAVVALNGQIQKRKLFLINLQKRMQYWKSQRQEKEKLVYLNLITPGELATIDRTMDDISSQMATLKSELTVLGNEKGDLRAGIRNRELLNSDALRTAHQKTYFTAPVSGRVDKLQIPVQQICYRQEKVMSLLYPQFYVRAYVDMDELDDFKVGDHVVVVLPYGHKNLAGKVKKLYAVSELKDEIIVSNGLNDKKHGVAVDIVPFPEKGWDSLTVSNIPVKIRKGKINL